MKQVVPRHGRIRATGQTPVHPARAEYFFVGQDDESRVRVPALVGCAGDVALQGATWVFPLVEVVDGGVAVVGPDWVASYGAASGGVEGFAEAGRVGSCSVRGRRCCDGEGMVLCHKEAENE